jgi:hypothetical protein
MRHTPPATPALSVTDGGTPGATNVSALARRDHFLRLGGGDQNAAQTVPVLFIQGSRLQLVCEAPDHS